ncbi:MAG: fluoride efflux transporter FluC [Demequina sp.]
MFVGGCLGGAVRLAVDGLVPPTGSSLPLDIVAINIVGSFALGILAAWALVHGARWWVPLVGTGFLGGFTTLSVLDTLPWQPTAQPGAAVALLVATTIASVLAAAVGWKLGARLALAQERRTETTT